MRRKADEFIALDRGLRSLPAEKPPGPVGLGREGMLPQSTDSRALALLSCRALSSQPQKQLTSECPISEIFPLTNHIPGHPRSKSRTAASEISLTENPLSTTDHRISADEPKTQRLSQSLQDPRPSAPIRGPKQNCSIRHPAPRKSCFHHGSQVFPRMDQRLNVSLHSFGIRGPPRGYEVCQRGALRHSGRSCRTGGNWVTVRTCWLLNQQVGLREMLEDCARGHSPFP